MTEKIAEDARPIEAGYDPDAVEIGAGGKVRLLSFDDLDGRTSAVRRARDIVRGLESDLGGSKYLTTGQRQLIQRAGVLAAIAEDHETRWLAGGPVPAELYLATINCQRRVLDTLGLKRVVRDVTPDLGAYIGKGRAA